MFQNNCFEFFCLGASRINLPRNFHSMEIPRNLALVEHGIGHVFENKLLGVEALNPDRQLIQ